MAQRKNILKVLISRKYKFYGLILALMLVSCSDGSKSTEGESIARQWNEVLLDAIRNDFARPTVHARNLFHFSAASYDAWAFLTGKGDTYLLGKEVSGYQCEFDAAQYKPQNRATGRYNLGSANPLEQAISYVNYSLLAHRFRFSPGFFQIEKKTDKLMEKLGLDMDFTSSDYSTGDPRALGNYIAECYIAFGLQDGSNEANAYANQSYEPVNPPIEPEKPGTDINDINHWQPVKLTTSIDQSGNQVDSSPPFLGPEWGIVTPFSLKKTDLTIYKRKGFEYWVYHDPGAPPQMSADGSNSDDFKMNFAMVAVWSSHLDSNDDTMIDISPRGIGGLDIDTFPKSFSKQLEMYKFKKGGDRSKGYEKNPVTGKPYEKQIVKLGDYGRVLAEFWADGPDSETPPGHWFVILNYVNDHPLLERKFGGVGPELGKLEWDIKSYFMLGGTMHDVAITAWGIKGWYDYVRPVSAIRAMADEYFAGNPNRGLPIIPGYIEEVQNGDPLAGASNEHVGKLKLYAWRGPDYIDDPDVDEAGVGWILAENWWPYQRPSFVTPPFAGYVSGHSTYSRAAAEVLTGLTGSPYFPGGMGEFPAKKNEFLVFEEGPSKTLTLQWAKYSDASDQCSLSRIWGGIHPPADDINGRLIGEKIGKEAFEFSKQYFY